jgi:hypothetical protein
MSRVGYIKLHRKILNSKIFKDSYTLQIWIVLLLKASHSSNTWTYNKREYSVKPGELFTCIDSISQDTGINRNKVHYAIKKLKIKQMIKVKSTPYGSHIEIVKWKDYQVKDDNSARFITEIKHIKNDNYKPLKTIKKYI